MSDSGQDLFLELREKQQKLEAALGEMGKYGKERAEAERTYRIALAQKILQERSDGKPVTIISDICRGDRDIAKLKFDRDVAEVMFSTAMESIQTYKLGIRMLDAQISREWHS